MYFIIAYWHFLIPYFAWKEVVSGVHKIGKHKILQNMDAAASNKWFKIKNWAISKWKWKKLSVVVKGLKPRQWHMEMIDVLRKDSSYTFFHSTVDIRFNARVHQKIRKTQNLKKTTCLMKKQVILINFNTSIMHVRRKKCQFCARNPRRRNRCCQTLIKGKDKGNSLLSLKPWRYKSNSS